MGYFFWSVWLHEQELKALQRELETIRLVYGDMAKLEAQMTRIMGNHHRRPTTLQRFGLWLERQAARRARPDRPQRA